MNLTNNVYLLLGSNLGDKFNNLKIAIEELEHKAGKLIASSTVYQTAAWGFEAQPDFVNQAILLETALLPLKLLNTLHEIEQKMGRQPGPKWQERLIDIDILLFNNEVIDYAFLKIPHPELHNRRFALVPLAQLAPEFIHPVFITSISKLLEACPDQLDVKEYK